MQHTLQFFFVGVANTGHVFNDPTHDRNTTSLPSLRSDKDISIEVIKSVCRVSGISEFIEDLPKGYETIVGERGAKLSGGQVQRIGIARALYSNPSVVVFDEATSALDNITERAVMDAVNNLLHKKTIIMIAHRLSSVRNCDIIYVMDKGRIVASGSYEELLDTSVIFKKMLNS